MKSQYPEFVDGLEDAVKDGVLDVRRYNHTYRREFWTSNSGIVCVAMLAFVVATIVENKRIDFPVWCSMMIFYGLGAVYIPAKWEGQHPKVKIVQDAEVARKARFKYVYGFAIFVLPFLAKMMDLSHSSKYWWIYILICLIYMACDYVFDKRNPQYFYLAIDMTEYASAINTKLDVDLVQA